MPMDGKGKYHMNPHHAKESDKQAKAPEKKPTEPAPQIGDQGEHQSAASTTLHDHGDGTFHTEGHDGDMQEHPSLDHAMQHMMMKHGGSAAPMGAPPEATMSQHGAPMQCGGY